ncbi:MAG: CHASE2 domain-containing protein [Acidobacteria bacterium]|nr:CHASE2 domain-containing protein [Acidobacteriota bacterium]
MLPFFGRPWAERLPIGQSLNNFAMDAMIRVYANMGHLPRPELAVGYTFLDVDDETYEQWNEPFYTPRNKILEMIRWATRGKARMVIVDIDLSNSLRSMDRDAGGGTTPAGDCGLARYLGGQVPPDCAGGAAAVGGPETTPVVLLRAFQNERQNSPAACSIERSSFFENPRLPLPPNVYWATDFFSIDPDGVVRSWRLWEPGCRSGMPTITPSVQLRAASLIFHPQENLDSWLNSYLKPKSCTDCDPKRGYASSKIANHSYVLESQTGKSPRLEISAANGEADDVGQRIVYAMRWEPNAPQAVNQRGQVNFEIYDRVRAMEVVGKNPPRDPANVEDRVVVIGGSYEDGRDFYETPLGRMPGALIIINSIHSLTQYGQIQPKTRFVEFLLGAAGIVIVAAFFAWIHHLWAMLLSALVVLFLSGFVSFELFKSGQWLNFALPLLAIWVHNFLDAAREGFKLKE